MALIRTGKWNNNGVSESIGFLLIFTMVIAGIGLVTLYGYPLLLQQQVSADEKIMEKNMIVLQNDMKSLAYKTVPYKETSLKIGSGSLTVFNASNDASTLEVTTAGFSPDVDYSFNPGDLRYESVSAQTDVSLQNGAVLSRNLLQSGSVMLAEPRWFYDSVTNTLVINIISINSTGNISQTGIGTVQMALGETSYNETSVSSGTGDVYVAYSTSDPSQDYSLAWNNYFTNTLGMTPATLPPPSGAPGYKLAARTLVIKKFDVNIKSV